MIETPDIPRDDLCKTVNPKLFTYFQIKMFKRTGNLATPNWSEAEVVQWLDQEEHVEFNKIL
jgi:hypothetical protein